MASRRVIALICVAFANGTQACHDTSPDFQVTDLTLWECFMLVQNSRGTSVVSSWLSVLLALFLMMSGASSGWAQDEADETEKPAAAAKSGDEGETEAAPEKQNMLMWLIETSGFIGLIILVISIFFVHRTVTLFLEMRPEIIIPPELVQQYDALLTKKDFNGIYQASKQSESPLGQLVISGLTVMASGMGEAREAMDRTGEAITVKMEQRISMLAVIGSLGPMIGLLGTLKGMISSFSVIATSGTQLKAAEVAAGISEALVLTFEGVAISVPAIYLFALFKDRVATLSVDAQNLAGEYVRKIHSSYASRSGTPGTGTPA
jgi:biopolymer transport protein ExbB